MLLGIVLPGLAAFLNTLVTRTPMLYLLHFSPRYRHAGHYLGYTENLAKRFALHLKGRGSPLVKAAIGSGSKIVLVRVWAEDGNAEQEIKRVVGSRARLCPVCNPRAEKVMAAYRSKIVRVESAEEASQINAFSFSSE